MITATARKVLLADPDVGAIRALTKALRARGYQVQHAPDGSKALEVSVLRHPDVILFDEPPTDLRVFVEALMRVQERGGVLLLSYTPINADVTYLRTLVEAGQIEDHHSRLTPEATRFVGTDEHLRDDVARAWMNAEALKRTVETGHAHYFSRSRNTLWKKGETSGQLQIVTELRVDCDQDAVLIKVRPQGDGGACHVGFRSCFYRVLDEGKLVERG